MLGLGLEWEISLCSFFKSILSFDPTKLYMTEADLERDGRGRVASDPGNIIEYHP